MNKESCNIRLLLIKYHLFLLMVIECKVEFIYLDAFLGGEWNAKY